MKSYLFTALWGILVWAFATTFFILFGAQVLYGPGENEFVFSLVSLSAGTAILLWVVTHMYLLFDKSDNASLKFGIVGTVIGLTLDMVSLSNHQLVFPQLELSQIIAFTAWMSLAYALYLLIPAAVNQLKRKKQLEGER